MRGDTGRGRGAEGPSRPGAMARLGGMISCPVLIVLALLVLAVAVPLLEPPDGAIRRIDLPSEAFVTDVAFGIDGDRVFSGRQAVGPTVVLVDDEHLWRGTTAARVRSTSLVVDPAGGALIVALDDGPIQVLDPETLEPRHTMPGHRFRVQGMSVSADGSRLVSVDSDGEVRVWGLADGVLVGEFRLAMGLSTCALSPDGRTIVVGGREGELVAIDAAEGAELARWQGHGDRAIVLDLAFSPDGRTLASSGLDGTIRTWDADDRWAARLVLRPGAGVSRSLAIAPDGRSLAAGSGDGRVRVWDLATGALGVETPIDSVQLTAVCFAPDGRRLAVGSGSSVTILDLIDPA